VGNRISQAILLVGVAVGLGYLVVSSADGWADWLVFGVIVVTTYGAAVAIAPQIYARRKRTISRTSDDVDTSRRSGRI
jgi:O-antigen/teichoic acid export membrane protein